MNEQDKARIRDLIEAGVAEHGWIVQAVGANPPYSYTIGESARGEGHAEFLLPLAAPRVARYILNDIVENVRAGTLTVRDGLVSHGFLSDREGTKDLPIAFRRLHVDWQDLVAQADAFNARRHLDETFVWVVVLPDPQGLLPWEAGYDWPAQPRYWEPMPVAAKA